MVEIQTSLHGSRFGLGPNNELILQNKATGANKLVVKPTGNQLQVSAAGQAKVGGTAGWVVAGANNSALVTCPASQTGSTLVIPLPQLPIGAVITGFNLVGQVESAGNNVTIDAALRKMTAAAADVADASVGAIAQLVVDADAILSSANAGVTGLSEVVAVDESFYLLVTATTTGSTDIALQGAVVTYDLPAA